MKQCSGQLNSRYVGSTANGSRQKHPYFVCFLVNFTLYSFSNNCILGESSSGECTLVSQISSGTSPSSVTVILFNASISFFSMKNCRTSCHVQVDSLSLSILLAGSIPRYSLVAPTYFLSLMMNSTSENPSDLTRCELLSSSTQLPFTSNCIWRKSTNSL